MFVYDSELKKKISLAPAFTRRSSGGPACTFSDDNRFFAVCHQENTVQIYDLQNGKTKGVIDFQDRVSSQLSLSPGGNRLLAVTYNGKLFQCKAFDVGTGMRLIEQSGSLSAVTFLAEGKQAILSIQQKGEPTKLQLWDLEQGKLIRTFFGHQQRILCLTLSPDEKRLASGGNDGMVRLWDMRMGANLLNLHFDNQAVRKVQFTSDGHCLVAVNDSIAKRWNASPPLEEFDD